MRPLARGQGSDKGLAEGGASADDESCPRPAAWRSVGGRSRGIVPGTVTGRDRPQVPAGDVLGDI